MCVNCNCAGCNGRGCKTSRIARYLLIIGGLNWGLVGVGMLMNSGSNWNVVNMILGGMPMIEGIVYVLVGITAVFLLFGCRCRKCREGVCAPEASPMGGGTGGQM